MIVTDVLLHPLHRLSLILKAVIPGASVGRVLASQLVSAAEAEYVQSVIDGYKNNTTIHKIDEVSSVIIGTRPKDIAPPVDIQPDGCSRGTGSSFIQIDIDVQEETVFAPFLCSVPRLLARAAVLRCIQYGRGGGDPGLRRRPAQGAYGRGSEGNPLEGGHVASDCAA
jgi:hypothetical protein